MSNRSASKFFALTLASLLLLVVLMASAQAQGQATVNILASAGGATNPTEGTYTYNDGESVAIAASPVTDPSGGTTIFQEWIITTDQGSSTSTDNPLTFPATGGVTYSIQAVFQPVQQVTPNVNMANAAIVVVLAAVGGTTTPAPGTYALADATSLDLTATPDSGWQFSHWVISGNTTEHGAYPYTQTPTDNPYNVNHGYGYTFSYQPVFTPPGTTTSPTPTATSTPGGIIGGISTDTAIIIALVVIIIVILIAFAVYAARRRK